MSKYVKMEKQVYPAFSLHLLLVQGLDLWDHQPTGASNGDPLPSAMASDQSLRRADGTLGRPQELGRAILCARLHLHLHV